MPNPEMFLLLQGVTDTDSVSWGASMVLAVATVITGLSAGVFFTFQVSINRALAAVDDTTYVGTFQSINRTIQNPWFLSVFLGSPVLVAVATVMHWQDQRAIAWVIAIGLVLQMASVAITIGGNVPLNNQLDQVGVVRGADATQARAAFEASWNRLHLVRTVATVVGFVALGVASVLATQA